MQVAVFHPGTQHSWQTAQALQELKMLEWYATSIFYQPERWPYRAERLLPGPIAARLHREFLRFHHPGLDPAHVRTAGLAEWLERIAARAGLRGLSLRIDRYGNRRFGEMLEQAIAGPDEFGLWGYSGSSRFAFEAARRRGRIAVLDRTIGDGRAYNAAMAALQAEYGQWFLETERAVAASVIENDQAEYELADAIVVGSEYAAATVRDQGGAGIAGKVSVLPYCFDAALFGNQPAPRPIAKDRPLRFLFVGLVNPRKGIHHLLEAIAQIPPSACELTIVGDLRIPREVFGKYADRVNYIATVPRREIPSIMAAHDILVFPSYFEGSALSLLEALASGMGIIQTQAAGNGADASSGIVLDAPSTEGLYGAMMAAIEDHARVDAWRRAAQQRSSCYTFAAYRDNIASLLAGLETGVTKA